MCKTALASLVLYCLLFSVIDPAQAGVVGKVSCDGRSIGFAIDITGPIEDATFDEVREVFTKYHQQQNEIANGGICPEKALKGKPLDFSAYGHRFSIDSTGGSVIAAMKIGRLLRQERESVMVEGVCFSACVFVLAGAVDRAVFAPGKVGIHRPYLVSYTSDARHEIESALRLMRDYLREMDVSPQLADDMIAVEPEDNRVLTASQLASYGLLGVDRAEKQQRAIDQEVRDLEEAKALGLDRREYNRRKSRAKLLCSGPEASPDCRKMILQTGQP
ncbi:ATP-dependent Clp protease proteolytic subunit [Bradyrhizobium arachidis]|uniref:ATP-dependent Clp protease proteolytic subunit n=1 Tax=Bradyrhizobium arachidis TaxID=858423 RepID=UPI0008E929B1|nr:ATP-dependent Clp protease proteolytic subunit [Bradyrhizobium arachidis]SFV19868.1 Clp protease [Bradyrhizobium arachidis]